MSDSREYSGTPAGRQATVLVPDRSQVEQFYDALFRHAWRGSVLMRAFSGRKPWGVADWWRAVSAWERADVVGGATAFAAACARAPGAVVFCPPVATFTGRSAGEEAVSLGLALSVECDTYPVLAREVLEDVLGPATVVMASGSGWPNPDTGELEARTHLHWRLGTPTEARAGREALRDARRLAQKLAGSDGTAVPVCHPLRWPGSWNTKGEPRMARIVGGEPGREVELDTALALLRRAVRSLPGGAVLVDQPQRPGGELLAHSIEEVAHTLWVIPNDGDPNGGEASGLGPRRGVPYDQWVYVSLAAFGATGGSEQGYELFRLWSMKSPKFCEEDTRARWEQLRKYPPARIGMGTLAHMARPHSDGPEWWVGEAMRVLEELP